MTDWSIDQYTINQHIYIGYFNVTLVLSIETSAPHWKHIDMNICKISSLTIFQASYMEHRINECFLFLSFSLFTFVFPTFFKKVYINCSKQLRDKLNHTSDLDEWIIQVENLYWLYNLLRTKLCHNGQWKPKSSTQWGFGFKIRVKTF